MTQSLVAALDEVVAAGPERPLFHYYDSRGRQTEAFTRAAFQARSYGIARGLAQEAGVRQGDRVVLAYPSCTEMVAAFFAALRLGAVPVPVPPLAQQAGQVRLAQVIADCAPTAMLTSGGARSLTLPTYDSTLWCDADPDQIAAVPATGSTLALLQYTSGSTSKPKGVMVTHANILHNCRLVVDHDAPVAVTWLPQHHDMGLIGYCLYPALAGGQVHGFSAAAFMARPQLWLDLMTRTRATATSAPNFAYDLVLDRTDIADLARFDLSSMRFMMVAAEPVRPDTYHRFLRALGPRGLDPAALYAAYGLAEATLAVTSYGRIAPAFGRKDLALGRAMEATSVSGIAASTRLMSCGRPLGDTRVAIVDRTSGHHAADGAVGEIWISGSSVAAGYWQQEEASKATFANQLNGDRVPYLATGDLGFLHRGELIVCGRSKDLVILRGQNFHPQDIEASIGLALGLRDGDVAAVEMGGEEGARLVVLIDGKQRRPVCLKAGADALRADLGIAADEILRLTPRSLPRTTSGKLMRHRAALLLEEGGLEVLERWTRPEREQSERPFGWLLQRYNLTGEEEASLSEIGIDSLDLVGLMHELQEWMAAHGAGAMAGAVDARLVQRLAVRRLFSLAAMAEKAPGAVIARLGKEIAKARAQARAADARAMAADAMAWANLPQPLPPSAPDGPVLLTGGTGFLGAYLLRELAMRGRDVVALVRAADAGTARERIRRAMESSGFDAEICAMVAARTDVVCGDLGAPGLGLLPRDRDRLAEEAGAILHNGAVVNYLFDYGHMRGANVAGTRALLELAAQGRTRPFNHISTTFIFGWATKPVLLESDCNSAMELLDFGYSQSKWSSERLVAAAGAAGLPVRIFRPALITPSVEGGGNAFDITIRLLKFMIDHGIGVTAQNQVSFTPVDVVAANVVGIGDLPDTVGQTFHVVRDDFASMRDITDAITAQTGRAFEPFALRDFVPEVIRRCTRRDLLFPLLDFLIGSIDNISGMEFKRYDSTAYQAARARIGGVPDPSLDDTVGGILRFMRRQGLDRP